ncbi:hypothetical protein [Sporosarcina ureae]|uniref:hypothetical protein n=1 Tax=Sporosarcina ureae TaxID=1571 RepID=UPI001E5ABF87|nr:hypothetical protein [Sporosarcina ureae]
MGTVLRLVSAVAWAFATLLVKVHGYRFDTWVMTAYQMLFGFIYCRQEIPKERVHFCFWHHSSGHCRDGFCWT